MLDDFTPEHHGNVVGDVGHHAEVVRDENDGHAEVVAEFLQQPEDLRLHGDVERGGGLVGDENFRVGDERHGNHHALAHAAGEFVRIRMHAFGGVTHTHFLEHRDGAAKRLVTVGLPVNQQRLDELLGNAQVRIERSHWVLENHRDAFAAQGAQFSLGALEQVAAVEDRNTVFNSAGRRGHEAH